MAENGDKHKNNANEVAKQNNDVKWGAKHKNDGKWRC